MNLQQIEPLQYQCIILKENGTKSNAKNKKAGCGKNVFM